MTLTPSDLLARAETADPETAAMLKQAARDAAEVERLRAGISTIRKAVRFASAPVPPLDLSPQPFGQGERRRLTVEQDLEDIMNSVRPTNP
jgi:hypothetical protein